MQKSSIQVHNALERVMDKDLNFKVKHHNKTIKLLRNLLKHNLDLKSKLWNIFCKIQKLFLFMFKYMKVQSLHLYISHM